jgi:membrane protease YdiL (CAAX protease family)
MKYLKLFGKVIAVLLIYYAMQILFTIVVAVNAVLSGMNKSALLNYIVDISVIILVPSIIISIFIYFLMYRKNEKSLFTRCNFKKINISEAVLIVIIIFGASLVIGGFTEYFSKYFPSYQETTNTIQAGLTSILGMLTVILLAPMFEEILFRGIILSELKDNMNLKLAVIIQGITFGIYHLNLFQGMYAAVLGLILGFICVRAKSIFASMLGHITFNFLGTIVVGSIISFTSGLGYLYIVLGIVILAVSLYIFYKITEAKNKVLV